MTREAAETAPIVAWCERQGLDARDIPKDGGLRILGRHPDGPGWIARLVEMVRLPDGTIERVPGTDRAWRHRRTRPRLVTLTELPPQPWLDEMADPGVIDE